MNTKKIALYCRVSTNEQTTANQKIKLVQYCVDRNIEYDIYEEQETSRKTRPIKQKLLTDLRNGIYAGVIVYKLDRWARSTVELILEISELINKGCTFISLTENIDLSTSAGRLQLTILSAFANFERDLISERTRAGLARRKNEGKTIGRQKGAKDKKPRKTEGYIRRMQTNPPTNNSKKKIA